MTTIYEISHEVMKITEESSGVNVVEQVTAPIKIAEVVEQGPAGPPGDSINLIDDSGTRTDRAYSSHKSEERLTEDVSSLENKVGNTEQDLVLLFENAIA